ncbi:hypothetical protein BDN71DRAFT_430356 [Pleurotus eryngii]|uniref:F-box domain-containing protein n=1 Tax=Pleurotus eryngii TaxID=5323 RepID=A0A9P5ZLJ7_PLEER|nr:hypothetical protein BDN71DRAFT_430356 [Pleurotus eryngii]
MTSLPNETLFSIVDQVNEPETLVKLLVVSRRFNAIAFRPLYKEISFHLSSHPRCRSISTSCRDIQTIPGVQFTTTFATYFLRICGVRYTAGSWAHTLPGQYSTPLLNSSSRRSRGIISTPT